MKPNTSLGIARQGSLGGEKVLMDLDMSGIMHIMNILTDLYPNPTKAIIREYATNALDSHIEAGQTRPIEVTLPSDFSPYYRVKDYGVGLSVDDVKNVYSKYGASTKRDSDDVTGMLGLGSKSALTFAPQFKVTSVKNGVKMVAVCGREDNGQGFFEILDTKGTTEPNGVEIEIPAKASEAFNAQVYNFFYYWKPGTVLVNGKETPHFDGVEICPGVYLKDKDGEDARDMVVMGGVAYPAPWEHPLDNRRVGDRNYSLVAFVPMGSVQFTPSRDDLNMQPETVKYLQSIRANVIKALPDHAQKMMKEATNHREATQIRNKVESYFGSQVANALRFNGQEIPVRWQKQHFQFTLGASRNSVQTQSSYSEKANRYYSDPNKDRPNQLMVSNYPTLASGVSYAHKAKVRQYLKDKGLDADIRAVLFFSDEENEPWLAHVPHADWSDIKAIRLNPVSGTGGGAPAKAYYEFYIAGQYHEKNNGDLLDATKPIYYESPANYSNFAWMSKMFPDAQIVEIGMNRWDKLKRDYPHAEQIGVVLHRARTAAQDALTHDDKVKIQYDNDWQFSRKMKALPTTGIDDPVLAAARALTGTKQSDRVVRWRELGQTSLIFGKAEVFKGYPLVSDHEGHKKHNLIYVNAVYAANQEGNEDD